MALTKWDVNIQHLSRWKAGLCDQFGCPTLLGLHQQAVAGRRYWWRRVKSLRADIRRCGPDLTRDALIADHVTRAWSYRREARRIRASIAAQTSAAAE